MTRCTVIRKDGSFTASMAAIVTCRCLPLLVRCRCGPNFAPAMATRPAARSMPLRRSSRRCENVASRRESLCAPTAAFVARRLWPGAKQPVVYYCLGLARNGRLRELIDEKFARVRESAILCGGVARGFTEFQYQTLKSWTRGRRVIAKAEVLQDKDNPRFIVTNLPAEGFEDEQQSADRFCAQKCYEDFYCARGDMENQIKQQYLDLEADRTSSHWMASNQLRLWFSAFALLLFQRLRTLALQGTELAKATAGTIRQRLLKIGALVTVSTRRVYVRLASAFPLQKLFAQVHRALAGLVAEDG